MNNTDRKILSGNEAVARGAWEAGCRFAAAYPGTPSTEILENIIKYSEIYTEWSVNEKVALEVCAGASFAGARAITAMKHVGLNVAADPMFTLGYTGVTGGFIIVTCDDPGMWSSQNEQDNRYYARHAKIPMLEPSDSNEAKIFTKLAFELSEKFDSVFLLRMTTRISHSSGIVECGLRQEIPLKGYIKDIKKRLVLPAHARVLHKKLEERLMRIADYSEEFVHNRIEWRDRALGIISSGIAYMYAKEVFPEASFLKLSLTYPLPEKLIRKFARELKKIIVIEEGDPILEQEIKAMGIEVIGKDRIPLCGELDPTVLKRSFDKKVYSSSVEIQDIPERPPVLCPGCPERGVFYVINKLKLIATGDIGCYTLGALPPLNAMDTCICMGASVTNAHGMDKAGGKEINKKLVAVIGDSTFFHSGITGLLNAVYNRGNLNLIILDNMTTAMTGHQPHPGTGKLTHGEEGRRILPEEVARGCGAEFVKVVDPTDLKATEQAIKEALNYEGVAVLVFRSLCALLKKPRSHLTIDIEKCNGCTLCLGLGCPAISLKNIENKEKPVAFIEPTLCTGCDLCFQLCQHKAILPSKKD